MTRPLAACRPLAALVFVLSSPFSAAAQLPVDTATPAAPTSTPASAVGPGAFGSASAMAAPVDPRAAPIDIEDEIAHARDRQRTYLDLLYLPPLLPIGRWSGRIEVAPLPAHALFIEGSLLRIEPGVSGYAAAITGRSLDIGYHLFPAGVGLRGFYVGPRAFWGSGTTDLAKGTFVGYGVDGGYQWVSGHIALNFGLGAAYTKLHGGAADGIADRFKVPKQYQSLIAQQSVRESYVLPLFTAGFGLIL